MRSGEPILPGRLGWEPSIMLISERYLKLMALPLAGRDEIFIRGDLCTSMLASFSHDAIMWGVVAG